MPGKQMKRGQCWEPAANAQEVVSRLMECSGLVNSIVCGFDDKPLGNATSAEENAIATSKAAWDALMNDICAIANRVGRIPLPR